MQNLFRSIKKAKINFKGRLKKRLNQNRRKNLPIQERVPNIVEDQKLLIGKTALITGGGRNIGRGIALELAQQGAEIVIFELDSKACDELRSEIQSLGVGYQAFAFDITDNDAVEAALRKLHGQGRKIDLLVNNVGIQPKKIGSRSLKKTKFREVFETNVMAPMALTYSIVNKMIQDKNPGSILFITSIHQSIISRWVSYSSSKAALEMAIKELAIDLAPHNIRVNGIAPGWVAEDKEGQPKPHSYTPLRQSSINPRYIGRAAVYLTADYFSRFTTGTVLTIDAGLSLYSYRVHQHFPKKHE